MKLITIVLFAATAAFAQTAESRMPVIPRCKMPELPNDLVIEIDVFLASTPASSERLPYGAAAT